MLSLASCTREQLAPDGLYTIKASREGDAATKTYVGDNFSLVWAAGDKIGVFNESSTNNAYTLSSGQGTASAEFSAETPFTEGKLYAYYPYSDTNTSSDAIVVDLSNQTYSEPSDFGKYFYMVGSADVKEGATDINIGFKNPLAAFVFTVDNNLDHAIKVTGFSVSNSEPVFHQEATLDLGADDPTVLKTTDDLTNEISVTIDDIEVAAGAELDFPLVVLPANLADKKLYFTFSYISNGEPRTLNKSVSGKNITRNTFIPGTFTLGESTIGGDIESSWDGTSFSEPETAPDDENTYLISTPAELAWVAQQVNGKKDNFENKTLLLTNDINLNGQPWTPIGNVNDYPTISFWGTFDGQNHTISNLTASDNVKTYAAAGLFGSLMGTVKNVTLKNVDIRSTHFAGAVVAYSSRNGATVENCHVDGGTITSVPEYTGSAYDNGDKAGGIIGYYVTDDKVTSCTAKNLTITAYRDLGGIVGSGPESGMTGCSVENITLVQDNTNGYETDAVTTVGALGGRDVNKGNQPYDGEFASKVTKKVVGNVSNAAQLASALTSDAAQIAVTLVEDIDLSIASLGQQTGGSGEYKLGGENTESILINLDNHKLNLTTTYMSAIGAKNDDAVFTIKNGTMTSTKTNGEDLNWNIYDLTFANCNYKIENVVFEKSIALTSGENKTVTINDVTIKESHDAYAVWITPFGQTVNINNLTVTGVRGIKIDDQYHNGENGDPDDAKKATLNISNSKFETTGTKAAIMVKSKYGAEINVTNVDIANVAADPVFTVWVDEDAKDYADKVTVNGAKVKVENSDIDIVATSNEELAAAAIADNATIYLTKGEYVIPAAAQGKTVTFIGIGNPEDVKVAVTKVGEGGENCDYGLDGSNATFEGITITTNSSTYIGYARCNGTYKNCIIDGTYTLYGESTFENCVFNVSGNVYNIWTWGAEKIEFTGCTFNSDGKALLLYREAGGTVDLTVTDCTFNDKEGLVDAMKAAIEIGDSPNENKPTYNVTVSDTTVYGYDEGENTGSTLWGNKNSMPKERLNVRVDGEDVY